MSISPGEDLRSYLLALYGRDREAFIEIAHRFERDGRKGPMKRGRTGLFLPTADLEATAHQIERLKDRRHVWVGVVPRRRHPTTGELGGGKGNVGPAQVLWTDCDLAETPDALERIKSFIHRPHLLVSSGGGYHAYWLIEEPIYDPGELRALNQRLAAAVGGDRQSADAARILRPPGTFNFKGKYGKPRSVDLLALGNHEPYAVNDLASALPSAPPTSETGPRRQVRTPHNRRRDALQRISPGEYFRTLAGVAPDRTGKVCCPLPLHDDPEPSCHVYESPEEGWYCFGCGHGGDVYELAGELWRLRREGREFGELRTRLLGLFGVTSKDAR